MNLQQFLNHHGIVANPFAEEDAGTDPVFKKRCCQRTHHPAWDKIYGDPTDPGTSVVFGEKGAGKTALRLQMVDQIKEHNATHEEGRLFVVEVDNFNPLLDRFAEKLPARKRRDPKRVLNEWKLWDHMDSILSIGVTSLVDHLVGVPQINSSDVNQLDEGSRKKLDRLGRRDLMLLATCYDQSTVETFSARWKRLKRAIGYWNWRSLGDKAIGIAVTAAVLGSIIYFKKWSWLSTVWPYLVISIGWAAWLAKVWRWFSVARKITKNIRVVPRETGALRKALMRFPNRDIDGQPLPTRPRTDDRYEMLGKFQRVLNQLGYGGIVVLVDRVDEPHLINGSVEQMKALVWPMLDNKFLKQPGIGIKLLLPIELVQYLEGKSGDFYQRARLDKQNLIRSLEWSGESLYDLANARIAACSTNDEATETAAAVSLRDLLDERVSTERIIDAFQTLRVPRQLFKFLFQLFVAHCNAHTEQNPVWQISQEEFEQTLTETIRNLDAVDRGLQAG